MTTLISKVFQHREQLILFFMLEFIHFSIWTDVTSMVSRSLLLIHLGLFLLWQPIWKGNEKLSWFDIVLLSFISYTFLFLMDWWLIFSCVKGLGIWISSSKEYNDGENKDPVLALAGWICTAAHNQILLDLLHPQEGDGA